MIDSRINDEARIRDLIEARMSLLKAKDLRGLVAGYAPDVVSFDAVNALQNKGRRAIEQRAQEWLSSYDGPIEYSVSELNVVAGETVAFCRFLGRVEGTLMDGKTVNMWVRTTACLQKLNEDWFIVHEHTSVPFDAGTGSALLDLKP